jgi:DNA-binding XRE family transcriptional regulator
LEGSNVTVWEKGRYNPNLRLAFKIARAFEKRVEEVFVYSEPERCDESARPHLCSE